MDDGEKLKIDAKVEASDKQQQKLVRVTYDRRGLEEGSCQS